MAAHHVDALVTAVALSVHLANQTTPFDDRDNLV
jgi:hypothetical protein